MGIMRMINGNRGKGRPPAATDAEKVRLVKDRAMGEKVRDLADRHGVSPRSIWHWIRQGRDLIRASGQEF
jgi:transposase-like protein